MKKCFRNANIYLGGRGIVKTDLSFEDTVLSIGTCPFSAEEIELPESATVLPGFIDTHVHGAGGFDAMDASAEAFSEIGRTLAKEGTTSYLATTMTDTDENILSALRAEREFRETNDKSGARLLGVHLEGPFLSTEYCGAQRKELLKTPNLGDFERYERESGKSIKIVTLAPELDDGCKLTSELCKRGIKVSLGHTAATVSEIQKAIEAGADCFTHTYNAMTPLHHREIGAVGAALLFDETYCEVIADGVHVSIPALKLLVKCKPKDKIILITDAMRQKGLSDGVSELGGQTVIVKNGEARLTDGALAGSVLPMNIAVKTMVEKVGVPFSSAIDFATINPAKRLGIDREYGSIEVRKRADFTVLDKDFTVLLTVRDGNVIYRK